MEPASIHDKRITEIFANLELAPRAVDLQPIMTEWQPDLVVHEVAELAAPLVSTALGIPYVDVGYGSLVPRALLEAAGERWRGAGHGTTCVVRRLSAPAHRVRHVGDDLEYRPRPVAPCDRGIAR
jgi:hypothetical protein